MLFVEADDLDEQAAPVERRRGELEWPAQPADVVAEVVGSAASPPVFQPLFGHDQRLAGAAVCRSRDQTALAIGVSSDFDLDMGPPVPRTGILVGQAGSLPRLIDLRKTQ